MATEIAASDAAMRAAGLAWARARIYDDKLGNPDGARLAAWAESIDRWELDTPEALLAEAELRECLEKTIASLSEMQSSVLLLRERQGLALEDICNLLDVSLSNVRVLLHRARLKVFATLEHYEETGQC